MRLETFFEKFELFADAPNAVWKMRELILRKAVTGGLSGSQADQWETVKVERLAEIQNGFAFKSNYFNQVGHGIPLIRIRDLASDSTEAFYSGEYRDEFVVKRGDFLIGNALPKCASERAAKFSKTTLSEGDLLISKDGTIGKTAFVPPGLVGGNITQHMLRFAISKRLDRNFVRICIDAPPCQAWMVGETKGVALQGVNVGDFRRMPLPIPPLAEQRRIVAKVDQLMALVDQLETQLAASRATGEKLMEAVVSELTGNGDACEQEVERPVILGEKVIAA